MKILTFLLLEKFCSNILIYIFVFVSIIYYLLTMLDASEKQQCRIKQISNTKFSNNYSCMGSHRPEVSAYGIGYIMRQ